MMFIIKTEKEDYRTIKCDNPIGFKKFYCIYKYIIFTLIQLYQPFHQKENPKK